MDEMIDTTWLNEVDDSYFNNIEANDTIDVASLNDVNDTLAADNNTATTPEVTSEVTGISYENTLPPMPDDSFFEVRKAEDGDSGSSSGSGSSGGSDSGSGSGGSSSGSGDSSGSGSSGGGSFTSRIKSAISNASSAAGNIGAGKGGGVSGSLGASMKGVAASFGAEAAKDARNAAAKANAESLSADQEYQDLVSQVDERQAELNAAADALTEANTKYKETSELSELVQSVPNVSDLTGADYERYAELMNKYKPPIDIDGDIVESIASFVDKTYKEALEVRNDLRNAQATWDSYISSVNTAKANAEAASEKAREALEKAQAAKDKVGTLSSEAKAAVDRVEQAHQKYQADLEKKAEEQKANAADDTEISHSSSAINSPTTLDFSKALADAGVDMNEETYRTVADFVESYPQAAAYLNGYMTGMDKNAAGHTIAGIQAIKNGEYLSAAYHFAVATGESIVSTVAKVGSGIIGFGVRVFNAFQSFLDDPTAAGKYNLEGDGKAFDKIINEHGAMAEDLKAAVETSKTDDKKTFDYMKDTGATDISEYNRGLGEDVNKVVSDASKKVIHYSPYVIKAIKSWR